MSASNEFVEDNTPTTRTHIKLSDLNFSQQIFNFIFQAGYGQRSRPFKAGNYQSYTQQPIQQQQPNRYLQQYHRDPYPQQSIQSYPEEGGYAPEALYNKYDVVQNEILGSGNFEVIQGGTFYDDDTYYHANSNRKPYNNKGNFLENFRDFADIKGEYEYNKK